MAARERLVAVRSYREEKFNWSEPERTERRAQFARAWPIGRVFDVGKFPGGRYYEHWGFEFSDLTPEEEAAYRLGGKL